MFDKDLGLFSIFCTRNDRRLRKNRILLELLCDMTVVTCQKILTHTQKDLGRVHFRWNQPDGDNGMTNEWQWQGGELTGGHPSLTHCYWLTLRMIFNLLLCRSDVHLDLPNGTNISTTLTLTCPMRKTSSQL